MSNSKNQAGKGDKARSCFSKKFKDNYDDINWHHEEKTIVQEIHKGIHEFIITYNREPTTISLGFEEAARLSLYISNNPFIAIKQDVKGKKHKEIMGLRIIETNEKSTFILE